MKTEEKQQVLEAKGYKIIQRADGKWYMRTPNGESLGCRSKYTSAIELCWSNMEEDEKRCILEAIGYRFEPFLGGVDVYTPDGEQCGRTWSWIGNAVRATWKLHRERAVF
jgi:hypothetical protein